MEIPQRFVVALKVLSESTLGYSEWICFEKKVPEDSPPYLVEVFRSNPVEA